MPTFRYRLIPGVSFRYIPSRQSSAPLRPVPASVLSRVDTSIRKNGLEKVERELDIANAFAGQARRRIRSNFAEIDTNEDEYIKALADHAFAEERFAWDTV